MSETLLNKIMKIKGLLAEVGQEVENLRNTLIRDDLARDGFRDAWFQEYVKQGHSKADALRLANEKLKEVILQEATF